LLLGLETPLTTKDAEDTEETKNEENKWGIEAR
jgi:hypothetical protein